MYLQLSGLPIFVFKVIRVISLVSEDSDIIAFGAKAVLLKMDKDGYGEE